VSIDLRGLRRVPVVGRTLIGAARLARRHTFPGSARYWERRYASGGTSGAGSRGALALYKADVLNAFVAANDVASVVEFGCGDGEQLALARYPRYLGLDVSPSMLRRVMARFADDRTKSFLRYDPHCFTDPAGLVTADLALSIDVVYHLVEHDVYRLHLRHVFGAATRFVGLYTTDADRLAPTTGTAPHVRHRPVAADVAAWFPDWRPRAAADDRRRPPGSLADFFLYERVSPAG